VHQSKMVAFLVSSPPMMRRINPPERTGHTQIAHYPAPPKTTGIP
jgi:hypothetical protein